MNSILSYLDDEAKIIQYGSVHNRKLSFDGLHIDKHKRTVIREDNEIELTYTEFEILLLLAQNIGRVFSKEQIYNRVWKEPYFGKNLIFGDTILSWVIFVIYGRK